MSKSPTVSVVIASYNYGHYLPGALESALTQTFTDFEIVVIDDGSSDQTPEVIQPFLGDPRVHYHRLEHVGHARAKNRGLREARGKYVAFLDADDEWLPPKLEEQIGRFENDPELGVVYTQRVTIDESGEVVPAKAPSLYGGMVTDSLLLENFVCFSSAMIRGEVLERVGYFDETLGPCIDYDLWLRVALCYRFDYVDKPLVRYRKHQSSMTESMAWMSRRPEVDRITDRFLEEYGGKARVSPHTLRLSRAIRSYNIGCWFLGEDPWRALSWYLAAIWTSPSFGPAWSGLARTLIPDTCRRFLKRSLRRSQGDAPVTLG
jgi:glycosyltransferase involved in cell wall biosynthesis